MNRKNLGIIICIIILANVSLVSGITPLDTGKMDDGDSTGILGKTAVRGIILNPRSDGRITSFFALFLRYINYSIFGKEDSGVIMFKRVSFTANFSGYMRKFFISGTFNHRPEILTFEDNGETYKLIDGILYKVNPETGDLEFIQEIYDIDYFQKNYVVQDKKVYQKNPETGELYLTLRHFEDGFEDAETMDGLLSVDRWHFYDANPNASGYEGNYYDLGSRMNISKNITHYGENAIKAYTPAIGEVIKSQIYRRGMFFMNRDDIYFSAWFYLECIPESYFTIFDIESEWLLYGPGMRLMFIGDSIAYEAKFLDKKKFTQPEGEETPFPTEQWVHVQGHLHLSDDDNGLAELWQDGVKIIEEKGRTLPLADTVYNAIMTGVTVSPPIAEFNKTVYVDDVIISDSPIS